MYSESDFENFSKKIVSSALESVQKISEEAKRRAEKKVDNARMEAKEIEKRSMEALKKELHSFEEEQKAKIESEAAAEWYRFLSELKSNVISDIKRELDQRFEELAEIFLKWLKETFEDGELRIWKEIENDIPDRFNIQRIPQKKIVFSKNNLIIEFGPDSLIDEYSELIEKEMAKRIGV